MVSHTLRETAELEGASKQLVYTVYTVHTVGQSI